MHAAHPSPPQAREQLTKHGVSIVKDSSANKCGVICSSYEIVASMMLRSQDDFVQHKDALVADVLLKLRSAARLEATLLFREHLASAMPLHKLSEKISAAIIRGNDAIAVAVEQLEPTTQRQLVGAVVMEHLPNTLVDVAGLDAVHERVPAAYVRQMIAAPLAAKMVYSEGIDWMEAMPEDALGSAAFEYVRQEARIQDLIAAVGRTEGLRPDDRAMVVRMLKHGGVRAAVEMGLQQV